MLEIHLFVNPLGLGCIDREKSLLTIDHKITTKLNYQFVPLLNMRTISDTMSICGKNHHNLKVRNQVAQILMQVTLDYEAALFQGRRRGRLYLLQLQRALLNKPGHYSRHFAQQVAAKAKLDIDMFLEDRQSALARRSFNKHQQLANSFGILTPSTAVVVDTEVPQYSLLIDNFNMRTLVDAYHHHQLDRELSPAELAQQLHMFSCISRKDN